MLPAIIRLGIDKRKTIFCHNSQLIRKLNLLQKDTRFMRHTSLAGIILVPLGHKRNSIFRRICLSERRMFGRNDAFICRNDTFFLKATLFFGRATLDFLV